MNWRFWGRKKRKRLALAEEEALAKLSEFRENLLRSDEIVQEAMHNKCPAIMEAAHVCVCKNCPQRGKCGIEKLLKAGDCSNVFITDCSYKKSMTGELDGKKEEDGSGGQPLSGEPGVLTKGLCGEPTRGRFRKTKLVSTDGEPSLGLDSVG